VFVIHFDETVIAHVIKMWKLYDMVACYRALLEIYMKGIMIVSNSCTLSDLMQSSIFCSQPGLHVMSRGCNGRAGGLGTEVP